MGVHGVGGLRTAAHARGATRHAARCGGLSVLRGQTWRPLRGAPRIARFGGASFLVVHDIVRSDGTQLAKGSEKRVWGRFVSGPGSAMKSQPIPETVKALFLAK